MQFSFKLIKNVYVKDVVLKKAIIPKYSTNIPQSAHPDYLNQLMHSQQYLVNTPLKDYFAFPRLIREPSDRNERREEVLDFDKFISQVDAAHHIEIRGADTAGKSTLLRILYSHYLQTKCVLLCRVEDISSGNRRRIIRGLFEDQYGTDPVEFAKFEQLDSINKVILIDDLHLINEKHVSSFLKGIENEFGYVIYTTDNELKLDIEARIRDSILMESYVQFRIPRFNSTKRQELVSKIVAIKYSHLSDAERSQLVSRIASALNLQRKFIPFTPAIIHQFVEYYGAYQFDATQNDGTIFGKVFESSITTALSPCLPSTITVDKAFTLLGKIAYNIHETTTYPISENEIFGVIDAYCDEYGGKIDKLEFTSSLLNAKIISQHSATGKYKFCNNNYLAYFVASDICATSNTEAVKKCMAFSCFRINAVILMFVTYITNNPLIIDHLLVAAEEAVSLWEEFTFESKDLTFLNVVPDRESFLPPSVTDKTENDQKDKETDELEQSEADISVINVYDYDEHDVEKPGNQLMRAISLLTTIARCLPNFEHILKKEQKQNLIQALYRIPNKVFYAWAISVENSKDNLISFIMSMSENDLTPQKFSKRKAELFLQRNAIELLVELYRTVANNAYRENTFEYLCDDDWFHAAKNTYAIERLTFLGSSKKIRMFIKYAELLKDDRLPPPAQLAFAMTVKKLLIKGEIDQKLVNEIESKLLPGANHNQVIYLRKGEERKH